MKHLVVLPDPFLKVLRLTTQREQEAVARLGSLRLEFLKREHQLEDDARKAFEEKSRCVREGLIALGFDPDMEGRNFQVTDDGGVMELVNGNWVTPQGIAFPGDNKDETAK